MATAIQIPFPPANKEDWTDSEDSTGRDHSTLLVQNHSSNSNHRSNLNTFSRPKNHNNNDNTSNSNKQNIGYNASDSNNSNTVGKYRLSQTYPNRNSLIHDKSSPLNKQKSRHNVNNKHNYGITSNHNREKTKQLHNRAETTWVTQQIRLIDRDYHIAWDHVLGEPGRFGTAYLCWKHPTAFESTKHDWQKTLCCCKQINKATLTLVQSKKEQDRLFAAVAREIGVLKYVDHPNIVKLFDVYESRHQIHLITEYLPGGELFHRIAEMANHANHNHHSNHHSNHHNKHNNNHNNEHKNDNESKKDDSENDDDTAIGYPIFSEKVIADIFHQILDALQYLHERGIMHLDLKPENILFVSKDSNKIKLIDFGVARVAPRFAKLRQKVGTTAYMSPELIKGQYSLASDIWSAGVILFCMVFGYQPFSDDSLSEVVIAPTNQLNFNNKSLEKEKSDDSNKTSKTPKSGHLLKLTLTADEKIENLITQIGFIPKVEDGYGPWFPRKIPISDPLMKLISKMLTYKVEKRWTVVQCLDSAWLRGHLSNDSMPRIVRQGLLKFKKHCQFKAALSAFFYDIIDESQIIEIENLFKKFDSNGDGLISRNEFINGIINVFHSNLNKSELKSIFDNADIDGNNYLTIDELIIVATHQALIGEDARLHRVFNYLDCDNDGYITYQELVNAKSIIEKKTKEEEKKEDSKRNDDDDDNNNDNNNNNISGDNHKSAKRLALGEKIEETFRKALSKIENKQEIRLDYESFLRVIHPDFDEGLSIADWAFRRDKIPNRVRGEEYDVNFGIPSASFGHQLQLSNNNNNNNHNNNNIHNNNNDQLSFDFGDLGVSTDTIVRYTSVPSENETLETHDRGIETHSSDEDEDTFVPNPLANMHLNLVNNNSNLNLYDDNNDNINENGIKMRMISEEDYQYFEKLKQEKQEKEGKKSKSKSNQHYIDQIKKKDEIIEKLRNELATKDIELQQAIDSKMESLEKLNEYIQTHQSSTSTPRKTKTSIWSSKKK